MSVLGLKNRWDSLAQNDPFWAILTSKEKRYGRWDRDDFFQIGIEQMDAIMNHIKESGFDLNKEKALDFGCGVGRLTQAMGPHFNQVVGVDVSSEMIKLARNFNRFDHCTYFDNAKDDLSLFKTGEFDFVVSLITLQHIPTKYIKSYIKELVRILSPKGLLIFQLPSQVSLVKKIVFRLANAQIYWVKKIQIKEWIKEAGGKVEGILEDKDICPPFLSYYYGVIK